MEPTPEHRTPDVAAGATFTDRPLIRDLGVLAIFVALAVAYTRPLFDQVGTRIASDPYDPMLNATILWWNATVVPFTERWWNQPWFYPTTGVTAFTEHLTGLAPIATPAYWLTRNPVFAYNVTFFASWPLSAFGAYFLVRRITRRTDAGILAGLAYGFSPYRTAELGHLQSLAVYWLPMALGALHAYIDERRTRWLVLFAVAWLMQSLTNGYVMLFGAVLLTLWVVYFCSSRARWRSLPPVLLAWGLGSLPLVPILLEYQRIHDQFGLRRQYFEALAFSAHPDSWFQVSDFVRVWGGVLPAGKDDLFPGITVVLLTVVALIIALSRRDPHAGQISRRRRVVLAGLSLVVLSSVTALVAMLAVGPWSITRGDWVLFKMGDPYRALALLAICGLPLLFLFPLTRRMLQQRHPFVFYSVATLLMALFACGPVLSVREHVILDPAPYRWLMALPGFDQLRVPSRFWMPGVLCLAAAAGSGFGAITRRRSAATLAIFVLSAAGLLADGWMTTMPTEPAPPVWTDAGAAGLLPPILELPLGPDWDAAATYRSFAHGRKVFNGVSGYDPPHYAPLQVGLNARDPEMLVALATLGTYDIVMNVATDRDGAWRHYAASAPGAVRIPSDADREVYRVPAAAAAEPVIGAPLPIASVRTSRGDPTPIFDQRIDTDWVDAPQHNGQWLLVDLGSRGDVGGVAQALEEHAGDFPRHLAVDLSDDGEAWTEVWNGNTAAATFLAALREPRTGWLRIAFPARPARYVRIRQTADVSIGWRVPELTVNGPAD